MSKIHNDQDLKKFYEEFKALAERSFIDSEKESVKDLAKTGFQIRGGYLLKQDKAMIDARNNLVTRCVKLLGHKFDAESEIEILVWDGILNNLNKSDGYKEFIDDLSSYSQSSTSYILPNYLFRFDTNVRKIVIGPVEAILAKDIIPSLEKVTKREQIMFHVGACSSMSITPPTINQTLRSISWRVKLSAARRNLQEESIWLINIATSLFRLTYLQHDTALFPRWGEVEPSPHIAPPLGELGFVSKDTGVSLAGGEIPKSYLITEDACNFSQAEKFIKLAAIIFSPNKGGISERIGQGLGWMTKGRQSSDKSEKFLYFFTAIESLLSSDDKSAPIVQTISRHAATILAEEIGNRHEIASKIKTLYASRSALVHTGKRNVSLRDVMQIQFYAESLFYIVLEKVDINMKFDKFHERLNEASYGTEWP